MSKNPLDQFTSRWAMLISMVGIAIGTGNIWRFPRIAAKYDGGAFLIPWLVFLFLWSIPIILIEYAMGKGTRMGTVGAFAKMLGPKFSWMGAFVGFVSTAIMFYYSVVTGWCLYYLTLSISGELAGLTPADALELWNRFVSSPRPVFYHLIAITAGGVVIYQGIVRGIERANKVLVPLLLVLLVALLIRALTLPGALHGINRFFFVRWELLLEYRIWLDALTQNAWSTGAGWGLLLTYAVYMRPKEDLTLNSCVTAFSDHSVSLITGMMIFATVYALVPDQATGLISETGPLNTGLSFIWIPQLLSQVPGGAFFSPLFFLALSSAALSSLIAMIELAVRVLGDAGVSRKPAILYVCAAGFFLGLPSALSPAFFINQDWVWGVGLLVSGAFFAFGVLRFGATRFRRVYLHGEDNDLRVGRWYDALVRWVIPFEVSILILWWFWVAIAADPASWWNPFRAESVGTCLFQWGLILALFIGANGWIARKTLDGR